MKNLETEGHRSSHEHLITRLNPSNIHTSVEADLDPRDVKKRAVKGVASLFTRQVLMRALGFLGMLVLARILTPEMFGIFAIAQFVILFFQQVSSLGLSAALLRKKEDITEIELRTTFTIQQFVVAVSIFAILFSAPLVVTHYDLDASHAWLIRAMAISLLLASLKTIPTVLLERQLRHDLLAISEVGEYLSYQVVAIGMAVLGFGVWSLVIAFLVRGFIGLFVLSVISWWRPTFGLDWDTLKEILRFGFPIQMAIFVGLLNSAVIPVLVGSWLNASAVGHANFARSILDAAIFQPLIMMGRVQLRVFGRIQDEYEKLTHTIEKNLFLGSILTFLVAALLISQAEELVQHILTRKWVPILPLLYVLGPAYLFYAVSQPLMQALKALGDSKTQLYNAFIVVLLQFAVFIFLVDIVGLIGYAIGLASGIVIAALFVYWRLTRFIHINVLRNVGVPFIAGILAWFVAFSINSYLNGLSGMALSMIACIMIYVIIMGVVSGDRLGEELVGVMEALAPNSSIGQVVTRSVRTILLRLHSSSRSKTAVVRRWVR